MVRLKMGRGAWLKLPYLAIIHKRKIPRMQEKLKG
jgi:hypothetical protein